jgi:hypothetical protein
MSRRLHMHTHIKHTHPPTAFLGLSTSSPAHKHGRTCTRAHDCKPSSLDYLDGCSTHSWGTHQQISLIHDLISAPHSALAHKQTRARLGTCRTWRLMRTRGKKDATAKFVGAEASQVWPLRRRRWALPRHRRRLGFSELLRSCSANSMQTSTET